MVDFYEDQGDFMDFEDPEEKNEYICHACKNMFGLLGTEEPEKCPICGIEFD